MEVGLIVLAVALIATLVAWTWERGSLLKAFTCERNLWMQERSALLTRIQHWTPAEQPRAPGVEVQRPPVKAKTAAERMSAAGLVLDPDTGLPMDPKTKIIWESVEEFEAHQRTLPAL